MQSQPIECEPLNFSDQEIDRRLSYELYSNALGTVYSHGIFGALFFALFYAKVSMFPLAVWAIALTVNVVVRLRFILVWLKSSEEKRAKPFMRRMALTTSLVNGVLWASTVFFLDFDRMPFESLAASLMVFGLASGAAVYAAYFIPAFYLSVIPYLGSYILFHLHRMTFESLVTATILAVFGLMLYQQAVQLSRTHRRNIVQKLENDCLIDRLKGSNELLEEASFTDFLTGCYNRRFFDLRLRQIWQEHERANAGKAMCLIIGDIDHFKNFNDEYGHLQGDEVLRQISSFLRQHIRPEDLVCRYGGEEFVIVLPETTLEQGTELAERLRKEIEQATFEVEQMDHRITMSFGVSAAIPQKGGKVTYETILDQADQLLYKSKLSGRNHVAW